MTVKVVTDSSSDLPAHLVEELGITVVPLYVRFGEEVSRDGIDISVDEFYQKLLYGSVHPSTIQPTPQDFTEVYQKLSGEADGIISVHISSKLSGTCSSALQGREAVGGGCPIEVVDSQMVTMGLGLIALEAARAANAGKSLPEVVAVVNKAMADIQLLGLLDTLKYLAIGGRIGKAQALLGSVLNVKPVLTVKDGEVLPAGRARTRAKGIDELFEFVQKAAGIEELAVIYNTTPDDAENLVKRINPVFPREKIMLTKLGPIVGVHVGPEILFVAMRTKGKA
jgi:DegV family protein with EDD domain